MGNMDFHPPSWAKQCQFCYFHRRVAIRCCRHRHSFIYSFWASGMSLPTCSTSAGCFQQQMRSYQLVRPQVYNPALPLTRYIRHTGQHLPSPGRGSHGPILSLLSPAGLYQHHYFLSCPQVLLLLYLLILQAHWHQWNSWLSVLMYWNWASRFNVLAPTWSIFWFACLLYPSFSNARDTMSSRHQSETFLQD